MKRGTSMIFFESIPSELKEWKQFVQWKLELRGNDGKATKVPYQVDGKKADTTAPNTWSSFQTALQTLQDTPGKYSGLGFVLTLNDPFVFIDLDNCIIDGKLTDHARKVIKRFNSYTERSQSGTGIHIFVKAKLNGKGKHTKGFEVYDNSRYFAVTGDHIEGTPKTIEDRQTEVTALYSWLSKDDTKLDNQPIKAEVAMEDQQIVMMASLAKNGSKFISLYEGNLQGYDSHSEADQALCNLLAFYSTDPDQINRIFHRSKLYREKWDRDDYRESTIQAALQKVTVKYEAKNPIKPPIPPPIYPQDEQQEELDFLHIGNNWNGVLGEAAYHGLAGDVIRLIEPHTEADNVALLSTFLLLFGNLVGTEPHFKVSGESHRMKLFVVLVGATFKGRKGTSFPPIFNLMLAVDADYKHRKKSGLSSGEGVIHAVRDPTIVLEPVYEGRGKDKKATGEYTEVLEDSGVPDKRIVFIESEFSRILNVIKQDSNVLSPVIRDAWDGDGSLGIVTRNKPITATNTHISIIGHITAEELRDKTKKGNEIYNGFVNRFLWLYVQQSKSLPNGGNLHNVNLGPIVSRIREAVEYAQNRMPRNDKGENLPMERDVAADQLWHKIYQPLQRDVPGIVGAAASRAIPYIMRIACTYALLDCSHIVRLEHLEAALGIWEFNYNSVQFIFGEQEVINNPVTIKIIEALQCQNDMSFSEISNLFQRHLSAKEIQNAVSKMEANGLITVRSEQGHSGRPRRVIVLNKIEI
jgi:hypothetical protein